MIGYIDKNNKLIYVYREWKLNTGKLRLLHNIYTKRHLDISYKEEIVTNMHLKRKNFLYICKLIEL